MASNPPLSPAAHSRNNSQSVSHSLASSLLKSPHLKSPASETSSFVDDRLIWRFLQGVGPDDFNYVLRLAVNPGYLRSTPLCVLEPIQPSLDQNSLWTSSFSPEHACSSAARVVETCRQYYGVFAAGRNMLPREWLTETPDQSVPKLSIPVVASGLKEQAEVSLMELFYVYLPLCEQVLGLFSSKKHLIGQRVLVGISGSAGSGKTTTTEILRRLLQSLMTHRYPDLTRDTPSGFTSFCQAISMDAYHYRTEELVEKGLTQMKGRPETFNIAAFTDDLQAVRGEDSEPVDMNAVGYQTRTIPSSGSTVLSYAHERVETHSDCLLPVYDRQKHEPVANAIIIGRHCRVVLVEGLFVNYFPEVRSLMDMTVHFQADWKLCHHRLMKRKTRAGWDKKSAKAHIQRVDEANRQLVEPTASYAHTVFRINYVDKCKGVFDLSTLRTQPTPAAAKNLLKASTKHGVLFVKPAIVYRNTYCGNGVLGANRSVDDGDADPRGYVPVEWWIASTTQAENPDPSPDYLQREGISCIAIPVDADDDLKVDETLYLPLDVYAETVLGHWAKGWPLVKLLDIGGSPVRPHFQTEGEPALERPPIPAHVHGGYVQADGSVKGPGKCEAYHFPPSPGDEHETKTRLGVRPNVTQNEFLKALSKFGQDDSMYTLLNEYQCKTHEGWTILPGVVHAPGPRLTFEMQRAQDDSNLLSWQMGNRLQGADLSQQRCSCMLRGCTSDTELMKKLIDWELTTVDDFEGAYKRPRQVLESADWGVRYRTFFDLFYGECIEIKPGQVYVRPPSQAPFCAVVWKGQCTVNGFKCSASMQDRREFVVMSDAALHVQNVSGEESLSIYAFWPLREMEFREQYADTKSPERMFMQTNQSVAVVGNACLDLVFLTKFFGEEDSQTRAEQLSSTRGGNAANTSIVLAQLLHRIDKDVQCYWIGTVGCDLNSRKILDDFKGHGVNCSFALAMPGQALPVSSIILSQTTGSRTIVHHRNLSELSFGYFKSLFETGRLRLQSLRWVHFEGRNLDQVVKMIKYTRQHGNTDLGISFEVELHVPMEILYELQPYVDVMLFSREGVISRHKQPSASEFVKWISAKLQHSPRQTAYLCTWADSGAVGLYNGRMFASEAYHPERVKDTIGAGDTFNAAIVAARFFGQAWPDSLRYACVVAGKKCGQYGMDLQAVDLRDDQPSSSPARPEMRRGITCATVLLGGLLGLLARVALSR